MAAVAIQGRRSRRMVQVAVALGLGIGLALAASVLGAPAASAATTASLSGAGRLTVTGTNGPDTIIVRALSGPRIQVAAVGVTTSFPAGAVRSIVVNGIGGNDAIRIDDTRFAFTTTRPTTIDGGNGNDVIRGGKGAETVRGGIGSDTVTGLRGNDRIDLGGGPDLSIWTVGQGNDQVVGGPGPDTQRALGTGAADAITLAKQAGKARIGAGSSSTMAAGVEALVVQAGGGEDAVEAGSLAGLGLTALTIQGGAGDPDGVTFIGTVGPDTLAVTGPAPNQWTVTGTVGAVAVSVQAEFLQLASGDGADTLTIPPLATSVGVDAGLGTDLVVAPGTAAPDLVEIFPNGGQIALTDNSNLRVNAEGLETMTIQPGNGVDSVLIPHFGGSDLTGVTVDLGVNNVGDGATDQVIVTGSAIADVIVANAVGVTPQVTGIGGTLTIAQSEAANDRLTVNGGTGNDVLSGGALAALIQTTLNGEADTDTVNGGNGADTLLGGAGNDTIDGNQGNDTVFLGEGNDIATWQPGDGSDIFEGQVGTDLLRVDGAAGQEIFAASSNGGRLLFTRNVGNIVMDADDIERVELNTLGLPDSVTVNNLASTDVDVVDLDLGVNGAGDAAADAVTVNGTVGEDVFQVSLLGSELAVRTADLDVIIDNPELANDTLTINASSGDDGFFGGAGTNLLTHTWNGGNGNDVLSGTPGNDFLNGESNDDVILGGAGNDTINCGTGTDFADGDTGTDSQALCEATVAIP